VSAATALLAAVVAGCGAGENIAPTPREAVDAAPDRVRPVALRPGRFSLRVDRPLDVRDAPEGRIVGRVGRRTPFGTRTALAVVGRRGGWLAVMTDLTPNGAPGWVPTRGAVLVRQPYAITIDRSARRLSVLRSGAEVRAFDVAVGAPGTTTPLGRAGVTDTLVFPTGSGPYGCCAVALTSRQANLPPTWKGGAQIAIHGTADESFIGRAVSLGCVRGRNADLRWVIRNVPAGALVTVVR
jgi:lipoprotein-anchoring transpeptidase ErfK/SrfK